MPCTYPPPPTPQPPPWPKRSAWSTQQHLAAQRPSTGYCLVTENEPTQPAIIQCRIIHNVQAQLRSYHPAEHECTLGGVYPLNSCSASSTGALRGSMDCNCCVTRSVSSLQPVQQYAMQQYRKHKGSAGCKKRDNSSAVQLRNRARSASAGFLNCLHSAVHM